MARRDLPPLTGLRAFEAFARLGQMTLAADELCVTHGAISRQIRSLERATGLTLTQGPRHRLRLTEAGARLAATLSASLDSIERTFLDLRGAADRELRLSCVGTFAMRWLIPRLPAFHAAHPELKVTVTESYAPVDFSRQPFDAAIRLTEQPPTGGVSALAFLDNFHGPVLSPALAAQAGGGLGGLSRLPRLDTSPRLQAWAEWQAHSGQMLDEPPQHQQFEHVFYMLAAAAAGLGVGVSPWIYVAGDVAAGRLAAPLGFIRTPAKFYFLAPEAAPKPAVEAFRDWLTAEAAEAPEPPAAA
ncbi:LysR substrate-binding domain-containing protein [Phenylobacterium sp.]|uniref:LysR substrate-binding domain-containing protein n=1 Tax=Phenylobacterium sp. TaxID=1871053 RepID=UPI0035B275F3